MNILLRRLRSYQSGRECLYRQAADALEAQEAEIVRLKKLLWQWRHLGYSDKRDAETDAAIAGLTMEEK